MSAFERHDFVQLSADWSGRLLSAPSPEERAQIAAWQGEGRAFVVASQRPGDGAQGLRLGLAGPQRARLGLVIAPEAVASRAPPPLLAQIAPHVPLAWQGTIAQALALESQHGLCLRAFGSAAWQALTGITYLGPESDLDLLIQPMPGANLVEGLAALALLETQPRLDGEIRFAGLGDIAWREWLGAPEKLLLKTRLGARLVAREQAA